MVAHLRHPLRRDEGGGLDLAQPGRGQALDQLQLGRQRHRPASRSAGRRAGRPRRCVPCGCCHSAPSKSTRSTPSTTWSPGAQRKALTVPSLRRADGVLHLHRLQHQQRRALLHAGADRGDQRDHLARHRRRQPAFDILARAAGVQRVQQRQRPGASLEEHMPALGADHHRGMHAAFAELRMQLAVRHRPCRARTPCGRPGPAGGRRPRPAPPPPAPRRHGAA